MLEQKIETVVYEIQSLGEAELEWAQRQEQLGVEAWRATLTEKQRVEWASPDTIVRRCPVFNKPKPATAEAKPSPYAKLQQANAELQIELHDVKRRAADGDLFDLKNESVETIAGTIIEKVGIDKAVRS